MTYQPIIGLEVHVELATESGMFCGCSGKHFLAKPNTNTCPVCLGLPGALPVPNKKAIEWTLLLGLALSCKINEESRFDRKNYIYPDLPKGYQITQLDYPLCGPGELEITTLEGKKKIQLRRIHLEEDTGKIQHTELNGEKVALIDFNRSGVPLVEIVTEPDFRNVEEVDVFLKKLQQIIRYLEISNADMEKGTMRIEPSVSLRALAKQSIKFQGIASSKTPRNDDDNDLPNYRVELKNINSFRFVRRAIGYEIKRQTEMLERGEIPTQQTRGWSQDKGITIAQREKEEAHDYRYFPEPDIPPMRFTQNSIRQLADQIGELPDAKKERFIKDYNLSEYDANLLTETKERAELFESAVKKGGNPKVIANWLINKKSDASVGPNQLLRSIKQATTVEEVPQAEIDVAIKSVIEANLQAVDDYKKGKEQALMFLVGQTMRALKKKVNPTTIVNRLKQYLS